MHVTLCGTGTLLSPKSPITWALTGQKPQRHHTWAGCSKITLLLLELANTFTLVPTCLEACDTFCPPHPPLSAKTVLKTICLNSQLTWIRWSHVLLGPEVSSTAPTFLGPQPQHSLKLRNTGLSHRTPALTVWTSGETGEKKAPVLLIKNPSTVLPWKICSNL